MVRAQQGGTPTPQQQQQQADDEARLEALEAAAKARKVGAGRVGGQVGGWAGGR